MKRIEPLVFAVLAASVVACSDGETSVGPSASVMLVDLEPADPSSALVPARVAYHDDRALGAEMPPALVVYPARGVVLSSAHRYAAVVTTAVHGEDGQAIGASAA